LEGDHAGAMQQDPKGRLGVK